MTPWTVARQAPLSMGFSRQVYWSGLPCPPPGDLPNPGIEAGSLHCRQILYRLSHQGSPEISKWFLKSLQISFVLNLNWTKQNTLFFLLEYSCFTMLVSAVQKVNQLHAYLYPLFLGFLSHLDHHRAYSSVPWAKQQVLITHPFYT